MFTHRVLCYSVFGLEAEFNDSGDLEQGYLFGANTYSTNPILTYKKSGSNLTYHYYHNDHLFTPQRLTDATGVLSWSADYWAFGEVTITTECDGTIKNADAGEYEDEIERKPFSRTEIKYTYNDYPPSR